MLYYKLKSAEESVVARISVFVRVYVYVYVCVCMCMYMCV